MLEQKMFSSTKTIDQINFKCPLNLHLKYLSVLSTHTHTCVLKPSN
jgi:hypothetical protein